MMGLFGMGGPRSAPITVETDTHARQMGGTYPGPYDSGHAWRNWHPTARLIAVVAGVEAGVIIALTGLLWSLFPLKQVDPILLTLSPETKFAVEASRLHERADAMIEMQAAWVRRWIDYRFGVIADDRVMGDRVLWVKEHSEAAVYREFERMRQEMAEAIRAGNERSVFNVLVSRPAEDLWLVDFSLKDSKSGDQGSKAGRPELRGRWRATIRTGLFPPQAATRSEASRQIDPGAYLFGFRVLKIDLSETPG